MNSRREIRENHAQRLQSGRTFSNPPNSQIVTLWRLCGIVSIVLPERVSSTLISDSKINTERTYRGYGRWEHSGRELAPLEAVHEAGFTRVVQADHHNL
jgi:hypothetical protein